MDVEASSPLSSEWTSVRIGRGEDTVGQNVLAVRVLVTSEDSSSDTESDYGASQAPSAKAYEDRHQQLDSPPLPKLLSRHTSLREPLTRPASLQYLEEPQAMPALQRANSLQSPTPSKAQNWGRKFQSNSTPMKKRTLSPPKDTPPRPPSWSSPSLPCSSSSGTVPGHTPERPSPPRVPPYKPHSQASRGDFSPTPIYLRRARAPGILREIPLSLPDGPVLERAEYCLVSPGEGHTSPLEMASEGRREVETPTGSTRSVRKDSYPTAGMNRYLPSQKLALRVAEIPGEVSNGPRRGQAGGPELPVEKKSGLKKLVLTQEQKSSLLDWNDSTPERICGKAGERPSKESSESGRGHTPKPARPSKEKLPAQTEVLGEMHTPAVKSSRERSVPPPKSPLRLIANAIGRFLLPSSEGGKKASSKPESKPSPTSRPQAFTRSFSLRKPSSSKDGDQQSPGRHTAKRASSFFSQASPTPKTVQTSDFSPPDPALRTRSLPNRPSKMFPAYTSPPCSKIEDVPTLLEKVSLQETLPDAARAPKKRTSFLPSLRLKDKSFESFLQECKQRTDIGDFFRSPKEKGPHRHRVPSLEKLVHPLGGTSLGQMTHTPTGRDASSGAPVTEATSSPSSTSSSSADEESDSQYASRLKEKKRLRGRRKLEKQLVKQEELKRLHKAQAIQRQLEEVEERQRASEIQGVRLEKALRGEAEISFSHPQYARPQPNLSRKEKQREAESTSSTLMTNPASQDVSVCDSGTQDEAQLLQEWFKLVLEKNKLMRYESELLIMAQGLELEDHQSRLEQRLREKMSKDESQKDEKDRREEQEVLKEMMLVIEQRNKLVDSLEEQRVKEKVEDQRFENFVLSRGYQLSRT